jgi:hypothetical protein
MKMKQDLEIIKDLMDELINEMEPGEEDFNERLGRKKPEIGMMKIEVEGEEMPEDEVGMDFMPEEEDEDSLLKKRLMKMRG